MRVLFAGALPLVGGGRRYACARPWPLLRTWQFVSSSAAAACANGLALRSAVRAVCGGDRARARPLRIRLRCGPAPWWPPARFLLQAGAVRLDEPIGDGGSGSAAARRGGPSRRWRGRSCEAQLTGAWARPCAMMRRAVGATAVGRRRRGRGAGHAAGAVGPRQGFSTESFWRETAHSGVPP
jgi:hypothetical protein